jgi:Mg2+/Co2+ transporter CorB
MDNSDFWRELFDTYQSLSEWIKTLWLIVPPLSILALIALAMHYRLTRRRQDKEQNHSFSDEELIYTISQDGNGQIHVYQHKADQTQLPDGIMLTEKDATRLLEILVINQQP